MNLGTMILSLFLVGCDVAMGSPPSLGTQSADASVTAPQTQQGSDGSSSDAFMGAKSDLRELDAGVPPIAVGDSSAGTDGLEGGRSPSLFMDMCDQQLVTQLTFRQGFVYASAGSERNDAATGDVVDTGVVRAKPTFGGTERTLWAGIGVAAAVAATDSDLFVLVYNYPGRGGTLYRSGPSLAQLAPVAGSDWTSEGSCTAMIADKDNIVFSYSTGASGGLKTVGAFGAATLVGVYSPCMPGLARAGEAVYSISYNSIISFRTDLASATTPVEQTPSIIVSQTAPIDHIAAVQDSVLYTDGDGLHVVRTGTGTSSVLLAASDLNGVAADGHDIFVSRKTMNVIERVGLNGSSRGTVSTSQPSIVAPHGLFVYWVSGGCRIFRVERDVF